ncbi:hypothetical protein GCM10022403_046120 [Streptomyces coacervatus]|uniref:Uncharacterized protein n=1 Tax=Streptomyces coacervatus TaxID=647381 RepID=A0ABP7I0M0_9ACTN
MPCRPPRCRRRSTGRPAASRRYLYAADELRPGYPVREKDAVALLDGYQAIRPLTPVESTALPALLPLVHAEFALSELGYVHGVTRSAENTRLAYEYYAGHAEWGGGVLRRGRGGVLRSGPAPAARDLPVGGHPGSAPAGRGAVCSKP